MRPLNAFSSAIHNAFGVFDAICGADPAVDFQRAMRIRYIVAGSIAMSAMALLKTLGTFQVSPEWTAPKTAGLAAALLFLASPLCLLITRSVFVAAMLLHLTLIALLSYTAYVNGGVTAHVIPFFALIPVSAGLTCGLIGAVSASAIAGAVILFLCAATVGGYAPPGAYDAAQTAENLAQTMLITFGMLTAIITCHSAIIDVGRKRLEAARDAARSADEAKSAFVANISHEVRTPITGIDGALRLLEKHDLSPEQRELVEISRKSAAALRTLVNNVLDLSRIEAGEVALEPAPFDLETLLRDAAATFAALAREKGITLQTEIDGDAPAAIVGDAARLRQVLLNFIGNAVKFTERGGVRVRVAPAPGRETARHVRLCFEVSDTGPGISADEQLRLFERFRQAESRRGARESGSGLGLSIARELVELMGGEIGLDSAPGRGSRFWFSAEFPVADETAVSSETAPEGEAPGDKSRGDEPRGAEQREDEQPAGSAASHDISTAACQSLRILIVDDHAVNRLLCSQLLEQAGFEWAEAESGAEAVAAAGAERFDVILMDVQMPGMDGVEAARRIIAAGDAPPIVALTANAFEEDRQRYLDAGMSDHVSKPIDFDALLRTITRLANDGRARDKDAPGVSAA
ncbi:MAG: hypothetical protein Tsb0010_09040 [Parvularculaceae bacterium]